MIKIIGRRNGTVFAVNSFYSNELKIGDIPPDITKLITGPCYDKKLISNVIPDSVHELVLGKYFNQSIDKTNLPCSLFILECGICFDKSLADIPESIYFVKVHSNSYIALNSIPCTVNKLKIVGRMCKEVNNLPASLKTIIVEKKKDVTYIKIPFGCKIIYCDGTTFKE